MIIDLHTHTTESDGENTPAETVRLAKLAGIEIMSVTDHDSSKGVEEAIEEGNRIGVKVIPGIEFSASDPECKKVHILGYNIDYKNPEFQKVYMQFLYDVQKRNEAFVKRFNEIGIDMELDEVKALCKSANIRKPVFAKLLLQKGYIDTVEEAYEKYFNKEPFKYIRKGEGDRSPKEIISTINKFGGTAVLAHPYSLRLEGRELENKIDEYISYGLKGLECFHSRHTKEQMEIFEQIALKRNMIITKGSDFHGYGVYSDTHLATGNFDNIKNIAFERFNRIEEILK